MVGTDCPDSERAICRKLQIALSGSGQSVPTLVDTSVHILGCTQLVNVSSNHATVLPHLRPAAVAAAGRGPEQQLTRHRLS